MKKNVFLKLASALLVLCLASTCAIGTTFAKYTTADSAADTARVAKWGITVAASGTLFGTNYAATSADTIVATSQNVSSSNTENIVAPGTKNDVGFQVSITGEQPEVQYAVSASATDIKDIVLNKGSYGVMVKVKGLNAATNLKGLYSLIGTTYTKITTDTLWTSGDNYYELHDAVTFDTDYYPITWKVTNSGVDAIATTHNLKDIVDDMTANLDKLDGNAKAPINATYTLTWAWAFEVDDDTNAKDTILGNLMAGVAGIVKTTDSGATYVAIETDDYNLTINFNISVGVDQVN